MRDLFEYILNFKLFRRGNIFFQFNGSANAEPTRLLKIPDNLIKSYGDTLQKIEAHFAKKNSVTISSGQKQLLSFIRWLHGRMDELGLIGQYKERDTNLAKLRALIEGKTSLEKKEKQQKEEAMKEKEKERKKQLKVYKKQWDLQSKYVPDNMKKQAFKDFVNNLPDEYQKDMKKEDGVPDITESETPGMLVKSSIRF